MKVPCCSVCQNRYDEEERVPLLLNCGHGFCKDCLSKMFSSSLDNSLSCPRCRHVTIVGNSVTALRKNFALLSLASSAGAGDFSDEDDAGDDEFEEFEDRRRRSSSGGCGSVFEMGAHGELKLVQRIGEGRRAGVEMWAATLCGGGRCRHKVAVRKVGLAEDMDVMWVQTQLENLRQSAMWCRNVCTFHGVMRMDNSLCLVMDRCYGSVQSEMQRNEGRLTLEQILRFDL